MSIQEKVRELVAQNKIEEAINIVLNWATVNNKIDLQQSIVLIKGRYISIKKQENLGLIAYSDALRDQSSIAYALLETITRLEAEEAVTPRTVDNDLNKRDVILFLASNPTDTAKLQLEKEFVRVSTSLQKSTFDYKLVAEFATTPIILQQAILAHRPRIIHFSGHGENGDLRTGGIYLQDAHSNGQLVSGTALANMFKIFASRLKIDVVLLNACYSEEQARAISQYIPYVIGMNEAIDDNAAIEFSTGFYQSIATESDIVFAYELAVNMIQLQGLEDDKIPVLFKRA